MLQLHILLKKLNLKSYFSQISQIKIDFKNFLFFERFVSAKV